MAETQNAVDPEFHRLQGIAFASDESLKIFFGTPIYSLLLERRVLARLFFEPCDDIIQLQEMMAYTDQKLKNFFLLQ